jgi:hypothetical protein
VFDPKGARIVTSPTQVSSPTRIVDFTVQNEGSIFLLHPHTQAAQDWISEHIPPDAQRFGSAVVIEHRYICDIVDGIHVDGLEASND